MADRTGWVDSLTEDWVSQPPTSPPQCLPENRGTINTLLSSASRTGSILRDSSFSNVNTTNRLAPTPEKDIPEWKQQMMSAFSGKDIFSPLQLEALFRPPTMGRSSAVVVMPTSPPRRVPRKQTRSLLPVPQSSPDASRLAPLSEEAHARSGPPELSRRESAPAASSTRPALRMLNPQGFSHRRASSTSSLVDSEGSKKAKRKAERYADLDHDSRSSVLFPGKAPQNKGEVAKSLLPPTEINRGSSRSCSNETRKNEEISPVTMGRLSALSAHAGGVQFPGKVELTQSETTGAEKTNEITGSGDEGESDDVLGELNSVSRGSEQKKNEGSVFVEGESSVWPSSPPMTGNQGAGLSHDDSHFSQFSFGLEEAVEGYADDMEDVGLGVDENDSRAALESPFASPAKPPPTPPSVQLLAESQALIPLKPDVDVVERFHPGSGGTTILKNIRNHKDAPKSPLKHGYRPRAGSQSSEEADDPFFTPNPFRYAEMPKLSPSDPPVKDERSKSSGSPLKLFHSYYDTYTNERLRQRLGELESSVADDDEERSALAEAADNETESSSQGTGEDVSFSGGSVIVSRLEALARQQEKEACKRTKSAEPQSRPTNAIIRRRSDTDVPSPKRERSEESTPCSVWSGSSRKHRRWGSQESIIESESTPTKGRTPKRIRRSHSGGYSRVGASHQHLSTRTPNHPPLHPKTVSRNRSSDHRRIKMQPEPGSISLSSSRQRSRSYSVRSVNSIKSNVNGREGSPTPEPKRRTRKIPILTVSEDYTGVQKAKGGARGADQKIVFSGSKGDGMQGSQFFGMADDDDDDDDGVEIESPTTSRRGSVTTQDFLRQAEEVMSHIRGKPLRSSFYSDRSGWQAGSRTNGVFDDDPPPSFNLNDPEAEEKRSRYMNELEHRGSVASRGSQNSSNSKHSQTSVTTISKTPEILQHHHVVKNNGKMLFDKTAMKWVIAASPLSTDGDVFRDVSDLSVNSTEEARQLESARKQWKDLSVSPMDPSGLWRSSRMILDDDLESLPEEQVDEISNSDYKTGLSSSTGSRSSSDSQTSGFSTVPLRTETRTTSYGTDEKMCETDKAAAHVEDVDGELGNVNSEDSENLRKERREDSTADDEANERLSGHVGDSSIATPVLPYDGPQGQPQNRVVSDAPTLVNSIREHELPDSDNSPANIIGKFGYNARSLRRRASKTFYGRPISRITEEDEEVINISPSLHPDVAAELRKASRGKGSLDNSLMLNRTLTPLPTPYRTGVDLEVPLPLSLEVPPPLSAERRPEVSFHLTPKTDASFVHETTEQLVNLELSFLANRRGPNATKKAVDASFSIAQENLVKHLTDIEPFHPYWNYLKTLHLTGRKLETLYRLNEWCPRLTELDVSDNQLGQLTGVPDAVLDLKVMKNCLSDDTYFAHLQNLQFLDLSGNPELENLDALKGLRHLRELRADDCAISSIEGLNGIEGLVFLRARRNNLPEVDLTRSYFTRLTDLDLRGNEITSVHGLETLPSLMNLNLDQNQLSSLLLRPGIKLPSIRSLKLTQNLFASIDLNPFPNLRILYMDQNMLGSGVTGLSRLKNLDAASFRGQVTTHSGRERPGSALPVGRLYEVRKLYLSVPQFPLDLVLAFHTQFLNLQYLELASAQLSTLPKTFGSMIPNIRVLNLSNNALKDLRQLRPCTRLKKLLVTGNRVKNLKMVADVLEYWPSLSYLDVRENPLTIGFYPSITTGETVEEGEYESRPFELPERAVSGDLDFIRRLDWETRLRRRRWEALVGGKCARMRMLDGGTFVRERVFAVDGVWEDMVRRGWVDCEAGKPA